MDDAQAVRELQGTTCRCGKPKAAWRSFCRACYFRLPLPTRRGLYTHVRDGYTARYEGAIALLGLGKDGGGDHAKRQEGQGGPGPRAGAGG